MGKIIVSGASGQFGHAAAEKLLDGGAEVIALSRSIDKLADLAARGAEVRAADFDSPDGLVEAMAGGEKLLLISTTLVGQRPRQHGNAIAAAKAAGVSQIVYTSLLGARNPGNPSVEGFDHIATEELLEQSGVAYTFLRNSLYAEAVATAMAIPALAAGSKPENAGTGRVPIVSRDDCIAIAVAVLLQDGHENMAYDVTGPDLWTLPDAMALIADMAGKPIAVHDVDDQGMFAYFDSLGVPRKSADVDPNGPIPWASEGMVTFGQSIREGFMDIASNDVERVTGRKPRSLRSVCEQYRGAWPL
ncbi:MAG: NAD(P)H-binding protein [Erythrobacter sp.]|nr:MAG: NAD(P)H-binding protein [Erythrobacter sp.]